jgi:hypothetical protein
MIHAVQLQRGVGVLSVAGGCPGGSAVALKRDALPSYFA